MILTKGELPLLPKDSTDIYQEIWPADILQDLQLLHKKWSFPLRTSSVNATKSVNVYCGFGHIYWINPWWKTPFFAHWISWNCVYLKLSWCQQLYRTKFLWNFNEMFSKRSVLFCKTSSLNTTTVRHCQIARGLRVLFRTTRRMQYHGI